jgi:hypothetical protein
MTRTSVRKVCVFLKSLSLYALFLSVYFVDPCLIGKYHVAYVIENTSH